MSASLLVVLAGVGLSGVAKSQGGQPPEESSPDEDRAAEAEVLQAEATLFPIPQYGGDMAARGALTGDWGGTRTDLAVESGIQIPVDVNQYYQGILGGGLDTGSEYSGTADFRLKLDTAKVDLWTGGFLEVHGETYWGQTVNDLTGAALPVNTDPVMSLPAGNGTYLSHVVFTQFLSESFALFFGKLDTTVPFAIRWPAKIPSEADSDEIVHAMDLFPTLARIAGGEDPDDRVIDGIDVSDFLLGKTEKSGRDGFIVYMGDEIFGVKWRNWKLHFKEQDAWNTVLRTYTMPRVYNLMNDPQERDNVLFPHTWVPKAALPQLVQHVASLKQHPPIPTGALDPNEPPGKGPLAE